MGRMTFTPSVPIGQEYSGDSISGAETMPRWAATNFGVAVSTSGLVWLSFFTPIQAKTFDEIVTISGDTAAAATPTLCRCGLYTSDGTDLTLVARTANDTGLWADTFTEYSPSLNTTGGFPASYTVAPGQRYAFGLVVVTAGATPTLYGIQPTSNATMDRDPYLVKNLAGQTDLPTTISIAATGANNKMFYVAGA